MGVRGPIPKRAIERRRRNISGDVDMVTVIGPVRVPSMPREWHPIAKRLFRSMKESAQSVYYEPSDWAGALLAGEATSRMLSKTAPTDEVLEQLRALVPLAKEAGLQVDALVDAVSRSLNRRISAELLAAVWKMWTDLLISEAARRRARIEIERALSAPSDTPATVNRMGDYRERLRRSRPAVQVPEIDGEDEDDPEDEA